MFEYVIVGAGFAGSVIAERIATFLNKKVLLIEKRSHIGGNCFDYIDKSGIIVHRYGPHIFHTNHKNVFDYLSNFTEWRIYQHKVLALVDGKKIPVPFNLNSLRLVFPKILASKLEKKLLLKYRYGSRIPILELKRVNDSDLRFLADFIYDKIFKGYTIKQWNKEPEDIDFEVTSRVPIVISRDDRYFDDKYQVVPLEGYSKLFERMLFHPNIKLLLNTNYTELIDIDLENYKLYFLGKEFRGKLIFTGQIDELFNFKFGRLPYRSLDLKFELIEEEYFQETATINYPNNYDFTRITEFKHMHPHCVNKTVILKEYPTEYSDGNIPYYPVFTVESQELYNRYCELASKFDNIFLIGRLANYRYFDMDDIVKEALILFEEKIK